MPETRRKIILDNKYNMTHISDKEKNILMSQVKSLLLKLDFQNNMKITFNIPGKIKNPEKIKTEITEFI